MFFNIDFVSSDYSKMDSSQSGLYILSLLSLKFKAWFVLSLIIACVADNLENN